MAVLRWPEILGDRKMPRIVRGITMLMLLVCASAWAASDETECVDDVYAAIGRDLRIEDFAERAQDRGFIVSQACKPWPYKPELTLVALGYDADVEDKKELVVAVIDKRKRVISSIQWKVEEDAITELDGYSLGLDTARYQLAEDVSAFGLIFRSSAIGASCPDARWGDQLTLLVPNGKSLRPVLSLYRYVQHSIEGCLSVFSSDAIWEDAALAIRIENSRTNGFHDLRVTANITHHSNKVPIDHMKPRVEHVIFRYDGKHYTPSGKVPWWLGFGGG
jgi:hypothetical protein